MTLIFDLLFYSSLFKLKSAEIFMWSHLTTTYDIMAKLREQSRFAKCFLFFLFVNNIAQFTFPLALYDYLDSPKPRSNIETGYRIVIIVTMTFYTVINTYIMYYFYLMGLSFINILHSQVKVTKRTLDNVCATLFLYNVIYHVLWLGVAVII